MKNKDQILLEEAYKRVQRSKEENKEVMRKYRELVSDFEKRLEEVFRGNMFTKKLILAQKEKFQDLGDRYKEIFSTEYSLFDFENTQERLANIIAAVGVNRQDLKFETGPKGMIFWFETK